MRCHSPNGWLSGRFDPILGGKADGSDTIQSIVLSTDTEGISCEMCHRAIGSVTTNRQTMPSGMVTITDPAFNMLAAVSDWPHLGRPYPEGPGDGNPFGDSTLQFHDGMGYGGKYSGSFFPYFADDPIDGGLYTGQTYGFYPSWWSVPGQTPLSAALNPDSSYSIQFDAPINIPCLPTSPPGQCIPDYQAHSISIEHPTRDGTFIKSPEFCGSCHDLTVPVANHGMPEQRTYTEWKYSNFGKAYAANPPAKTRCQDATCRQ